jgi:hypothetical protein
MDESPRQTVDQVQQIAERLRKQTNRLARAIAASPSPVSADVLASIAKTSARLTKLLEGTNAARSSPLEAPDPRWLEDDEDDGTADPDAE